MCTLSDRLRLLQLVTSENKDDKEKILNLVRVHKGKIDQVSTAVTTSLQTDQFEIDRTKLMPMTEQEANELHTMHCSMLMTP